MPDFVPEVRVMPFNAVSNLLRIRIEQQFVMIEAQPFFRIVRPADPVSIRQSWACFRQITVPDLIGLLANPNAVSLAPSGFVKKAELDALCVFGKQCEVNSLAIPGCAQGIRFSRPDSQ